MMTWMESSKRSRRSSRPIGNSLLKRSFDLIVSGLVVLLASPAWAVIAIAIKVDTRGPVFYRSTRVGRNGEPFRLFKFRTMVSDADRTGIGITAGLDPRVTKVGAFLRRYKIDEMPQLLNVLKGEMSIVGPRPEDPRFVARYTPEQRRVLSARPGMASIAFIKYRHEESILAGASELSEDFYVENILGDKLALDLEYVDTWSFMLDLRLFAGAAASLFTRHKEDS